VCFDLKAECRRRYPEIGSLFVVFFARGDEQGAWRAYRDAPEVRVAQGERPRICVKFRVASGNSATARESTTRPNCAPSV